MDVTIEQTSLHRALRFVGRAAVDDAAVGVTAERAVHRRDLLTLDLWTQLGIGLGETCGPRPKAGDYMWITTSVSFTRCGGYPRTPPPHVQEIWPSRWP